MVYGRKQPKAKAFYDNDCIQMFVAFLIFANFIVRVCIAVYKHQHLQAARNVHTETKKYQIFVETWTILGHTSVLSVDYKHCALHVHLLMSARHYALQIIFFMSAGHKVPYMFYFDC